MKTHTCGLQHWLTTPSNPNRENSKRTVVEYYPMPIPNFDGLWCIILKLFSEKGDDVSIQGAVYNNNQEMAAGTVPSELTRIVTS